MYPFGIIFVSHNEESRRSRTRRYSAMRNLAPEVYLIPEYNRARKLTGCHPDTGRAIRKSHLINVDLLPRDNTNNKHFTPATQAQKYGITACIGDHSTSMAINHPPVVATSRTTTGWRLITTKHLSLHHLPLPFTLYTFYHNRRSEELTATANVNLST